MKKLTNNRAFALTFSLMFLSLVVGFMTVYVLAVASGTSQANHLSDLKKAYYVADAGLADAYQRLLMASSVVASSTCSNPNAPSTCSKPYIPSSSTDNGVYTVGAVNGNYTVSLVSSGTTQPTYTITSTGTYGKASKTLQLKITGAAVSYFSYWSQTEINPAFGGPIYWIGMPSMKMLTDGPVHTNGQLNIYENPVFNNAVTESNLPLLANGSLGTTPTSSGPNYYYGTAKTPNGTGSDPAYIFKGGLTSDVPPDNLVLQNTLNQVRSTAANGSGLTLTGASTILFNSGGTISVTGTVVDSNCTTTATYNNTTMNIPTNGVIFVQSTGSVPACKSTAKDGNATVAGTVKGQVTVGSDQNIYLTNGVGYNKDPRMSPGSSDMIGMVAQNNIEIISSSSPSQLEVAGILVAVNGSFQVDNYTAPKGSNTSAVLDQYGSIINYVTGATGEFDANGNLIGGWNEIGHWDSRLNTTVPPGFPLYYMANGGTLFSKIGFSEL